MTAYANVTHPGYANSHYNNTFNRAMTRAIEAMGEHWHSTYHPIHYTNPATLRYGYSPRQGERGSGEPWRGSYTEKKTKTKYHSKPLVWDGTSRDSSLSGAVTGFARGNAARVEIQVSNTFNFPPRKDSTKISGPKNMLAEIQVTTPDELNDMDQVLERMMEAFWEDESSSHKSTLRITGI